MANARLIFVSIVVMVGGTFQFGYQVSMVNPTAALFKHYLNASRSHTHFLSESHFTRVWSIIVNVFWVGLMIGCVPVSYLADKFGRKWLMLGNNILALSGTALLCVWHQFLITEVLIVGRFVLGIHAGAFNVLQSIYVSEISPAKYRGVLGSLQETCIVATVALGVILGLPQVLGNETRFFHLLWLCGIPPVFQSFVLAFCPESPKHLLLTVGNEVEADRSIRFFQGLDVNIVEVKNRMREEEEKKPIGNFFIKLKSLSSEVKRAMLVGIVAAISQTFTGILALQNFSTLMLQRAHLSETRAQFASVGLTVFNVTASLIALTFVEKIPRRTLFLVTLIGCALCNCLFVTFSQLSRSFLSYYWLGYGAIAAYLGHIVCFATGVGPLAWFLTSEMVPQRERAMAQSLSMIIMNVVMLSTGFLFLPLSEYWQSYTMLVLFVGPSICCFLILYRFMPETRGKETGEIIQLMRPRNS